MSSYVELHCHSNYSFQEGASFTHELLLRAKELGYPALALTDHDNLCGAMEFAQQARSIGIRPITGAEITLKGGRHLTLLAETARGYSNLCQLISYSHMTSDRREPELDPELISDHTEGLIALSGCPKGEIPVLLAESRYAEARSAANRYLQWFGAGGFYLELQQNLVYGDTQRNRLLTGLGKERGIEVVATNNAHYHTRERHRLQDALVAVKACKSLDETHRERRANSEFHLKSSLKMEELFPEHPEAVRNTLIIAERCTFDLTQHLGYRFPDYPVPEGHTPQSYFEKLCYEAAVRRYGAITPRVRERLKEEFRLIKKHSLAGFFLIYHEIIQMAREVMIDLGLTDPEIPLEERPPGRGRGSSVAMLVGYLIGLSHIDPLEFNLSLERFLSDEMGAAPDIDLDFPREIREELIKRVHEKWGWERAALSGMISTYKMKGTIRDLGKALGLPPEDVDKLAKRVDTRHSASLQSEMNILPEFRHRADAPGWRDLIDLSKQLEGFPKYLAQHPGGMIISSSPLIDVVPVHQSAMDGRYVCHWDKDSIDDAGFVKIDFLSLGVLSQLNEALDLIEQREGTYPDLSRIDFEDEAVYEMLHKADTIGIFQVESAAQMQTISRVKPKNLKEMAIEVAAVRPGVGVNNGIAKFIERYVRKEPWDYAHPLERDALERTEGIVFFQDQVNQLAMDVAGFSAMEADQLRRAFSRKNNRDLLQEYWNRFEAGAAKRGVPESVSREIFGKFSGQYMFPESHAYAFGITAYQMTWIKHYHALEFFVGIFNQQPMGFYNTETLKEDAKRHGIDVLNPDINESAAKCTIKDEGILLGLLTVKGMGGSGVESVLEARERDGPFESLGDVMQRTGLRREVLEDLSGAGAFDSLAADRRSALWEVGLRYRSSGTQMALPLPVEQDLVELPSLSRWEKMMGEYRTLGLYPDGHIMTQIRPSLDKNVLPSYQVQDLEEGSEVTVAGLVVRRQHPSANAIFITLEDEFGHIPLVIWPKVYERYRLVLREPVLKVKGVVSRRDDALNIVASSVSSIETTGALPKAKNWG